MVSAARSPSLSSRDFKNLPSEERNRTGSAGSRVRRHSSHLPAALEVPEEHNEDQLDAPLPPKVSTPHKQTSTLAGTVSVQDNDAVSPVSLPATAVADEAQLVQLQTAVDGLTVQSQRLPAAGDHRATTAAPSPESVLLGAFLVDGSELRKRAQLRLPDGRCSESWFTTKWRGTPVLVKNLEISLDQWQHQLLNASEDPSDSSAAQTRSAALQDLLCLRHPNLMTPLGLAFLHDEGQESDSENGSGETDPELFLLYERSSCGSVHDMLTTDGWAETLLVHWGETMVRLQVLERRGRPPLLAHQRQAAWWSQFREALAGARRLCAARGPLLGGISKLPPTLGSGTHQRVYQPRGTGPAERSLPPCRHSSRRVQPRGGSFGTPG